MKLELQQVQLRLRHQWKLARTRPADRCEVVLVHLRHGPLTGVGEAAPVARYGESAETVRQFLARVDVTRLAFDDPEPGIEYIRSIALGNASAKCALEVALRDGAAKLRSKPVYDDLGLKFTENHHITSFTIGIAEPDVIRDKVLAAAAFPVLKMKLGVPQDRANLKALRDVAPDKPVRVDANEGWTTKEQALREIEWLAGDGRIEFVEQPLPAAMSRADWIWLKDRSPLRIFADESYHSAADAADAAECFHGVNVKLVKAGGISAAKLALESARNRGLLTMLGCMVETSVLITAAAHLAELCDYLDLDGNLLITNDPYAGVTAKGGILSFAGAPTRTGLCVSPRGAKVD